MLAMETTVGDALALSRGTVERSGVQVETQIAPGLPRVRGDPVQLLQVVLNRLRSTESLLREREKLAGLGTLAAGLAHELNNPAAAIRRSVSSLEEAIVARDELRPPAAITELEPAEPAPALGPLDRSDRITSD